MYITFNNRSKHGIGSMKMWTIDDKGELDPVLERWFSSDLFGSPQGEVDSKKSLGGLEWGEGGETDRSNYQLAEDKK